MEKMSCWKELSGTSKREIKTRMQHIAHFLLINSDAVESSCNDTKISLIYFFFKYAKANDKECYEDFALYLLEAFLSEEFQKIQYNSEAPNPSCKLSY